MNEQDGFPERITLDDTPPGIIAIHLKRYHFALDFVHDKRVLDIACGVGYGSQYIADKSLSVVGVDIDIPAVMDAQRQYANQKNISFLTGNALSLPFSS